MLQASSLVLRQMESNLDSMNALHLFGMDQCSLIQDRQDPDGSALLVGVLHVAAMPD